MNSESLGPLSQAATSAMDEGGRNVAARQLLAQVRHGFSPQSLAVLTGASVGLR